MLKTAKKISMVICILFFTIMLVYKTGYVYAEAPNDQFFGATGGDYGSYTVEDLIFTTDNTAHIDIMECKDLSYIASDIFANNGTIEGFSGSAICNDGYFSSNPTEFGFQTVGESTFKLEALYALVSDMGGTSTMVDIEGYNSKDESIHAHVSGIDFTKSGTYGDIVYENNLSSSGDGEYGGVLTFGNSWYDIDKVVITDTNTDQALYISLDSLDFSNLTDLSIAADTAEIIEGQDVTFKVNLTKTYTEPITVNYSIIPDTATADDLETPDLTGILTIPAGKTYGEIKLPIKDDSDFEKDENFKATISNPSVGGITDGEATCTIKDNDSPPKVSLSLDKSSISEYGGTAKIIATLSNKTYENVTVNLDFLGAVIGTDFNAPTSISIPAGDTSNFVNITSLDNDIFLYGEKNVTVEISTVDYGVKDPFTPKLTITDDETQPKVNLSIDKTSISENGTDEAVVTATLTNKSAKEVKVVLSFGTGAVKDTDFTVENDTITIPSLQTTGTVKIYGIPNNKFNYDKTLTVSTSDADVTNATTGDDKSKDLTITNIDAKPTVTVAPVTSEFNENDPATTATFTVSLSQASDEAVTVDFTTSDGSAKSTEDYTSTSGQLTIPKGSLSGEIKVPIKNDSLDEDDEDFSVEISNPIGADLGTSTTAKCTIKDEDAAPDVVVTNAEINEVDSGNNTKLVFDVKLSAASGKTVTVNYSTADGTATQGIDYTAVTGGTLTFTPGETGPKQIEVAVLGDDLKEPDETVTLNLSDDNAKGCTATGTIEDDDTPSISINDPTVVTEGPGSQIKFRVSLSKPCSEGVSVKFRIKDCSAVAGDDYVQKVDTVTFNKGENEDKIITVDIKDDELYEGVEYFNVELFDLSDPTVILKPLRLSLLDAT